MEVVDIGRAVELSSITVSAGQDIPVSSDDGSIEKSMIGAAVVTMLIVPAFVLGGGYLLLRAFSK